MKDTMLDENRPDDGFGSQFLNDLFALRAALNACGESGLRGVILACLLRGIYREREVIELISGIGGRYYVHEVRKLIDQEQDRTDRAWTNFATDRLFPL